MQQRQPVRQEWRWFLGLLTKDVAGEPATVETVGTEQGTQVEADRLPLESITYDDREETVTVSLRSQDGGELALRHIVDNPWKIVFDPPLPEQVRTVDIEGGDGVHTLVTLHSHPALAGE
ncbi:MAG: hypothetical protein NVSMB32_13590 [Actinomycetota bacterium]